jgi:hypothetical protein
VVVAYAGVGAGTTRTLQHTEREKPGGTAGFWWPAVSPAVLVLDARGIILLTARARALAYTILITWRIRVLTF